MATLVIHLHKEPGSGKHCVVVKLQSDPDMLPLEHEKRHRELVYKLFGIDVTRANNMTIVRENIDENAEIANQSEINVRPSGKIHV